MAEFNTIQVDDRRPAPTSTCAGHVVAARGKFTAEADQTPVANDTFGMVILPAEHVPVDCIVHSDALDGAIVVDVGVIGEDANAFMTGATALQGGLARMDEVAASKIAASASDRTVGFTVTTGAGGALSVGDSVTLELMYRVASRDD